jgi:hypothetical protein
VSAQQGEPVADAVVSVFDEPGAGAYVYLFDRCCQPLAGPREVCNSAHVGTDGLGVGPAVRSTDFARLARPARAALGGR